MTYTASHKGYDHEGYNVPNVERGLSEYPTGEYHPAEWLPVLYQDTKTEGYRVIAAGKVLAQDRTGALVPAGLKFVFEAAGGSTVLTYTATDYAAGTIDLTTGLAYATNGTTTYNQTQVTAALKAQNLIRASEYARDFISWPVGYASESMWQWCGGDGVNPAQFHKHNFQLQSAVKFGTDHLLILPWVPYQEVTETQGGGLAIADTGMTFGTAAWKSATGIHATTKYASEVAAGDSVVAMVLNKLPVAKITSDTPITDSGSALASLRETTSLASLLTLGSGFFYIDYEAGVLFLYSAGGTAIPTGFSVSATITYYTYETTATGADRIASILGDVRPGTLLTFDDQSNFVPFSLDIGTCYGGGSGDAFAADPDYDTSSDATISGQLEAAITQASCAVVAQVIDTWTYPRDGLDKVRTQFTQLGAYFKMPGSATAGRTAAQVQAGAANKMVIINFCAR